MKRALSLAMLFLLLGLMPETALSDTRSLTQSEDPHTVEDGAGVVCQLDHYSHANHYWRLFDLDAMGVVGEFCSRGIDFAIEEWEGSQPLQIRAYCLDDGLPFQTENLDLRGIATLDLPDTAGAELEFFNEPLSGCCDSATQSLVIEFETYPCHSQPDECRYFILGANDNGQTAPSYISATECLVPEPTDLAELGFPDSHLVMVVHGFDLCNPDIDLHAARGPGEEEVTLDWNGCVGSPFDVFRSDDPETVTEAQNKIGETMGLTWLDDPPLGESSYYEITGGEHPPLADAGDDDLSHAWEQEIQHFGGDSCDPEGGVITYRWSIYYKEEPNDAQIISQDGPEVIFSVTQPGWVGLKLLVDDGNDWEQNFYLETWDTVCICIESQDPRTGRACEASPQCPTEPPPQNECDR